MIRIFETHFSTIIDANLTGKFWTNFADVVKLISSNFKKIVKKFGKSF